MQDNEFEKEIRQAMEGFKVKPSENVWSEVQKDLSVYRRRTITFRWSAAAILLLIAGAAVYWFSTNNSGQLVSPTHIVEEKGSSQKNEAPLANTGKEGSSIDNTGAKENADFHTQATDYAVIQSNHSNIIGKKLVPAGNEVVAEIAANELSAGKDEPADIAALNGKVLHIGKLSIKDSELNQHYSFIDQKKQTNLIITSNHLPDFTSTQTDLAKNSTPAGKWKLGLMATTGGSWPGEKMSFELAPQTNTQFAGFAPPSQVPLSPSGNQNEPTVPTPAFSYGGGLAVERKLSDRFSAVIGLRYHQLASNIKTGNKVALNTRVFVDGETRDIGYFYHNGDENLYTNRYHFVHLPVTVKWKMNKGNKTPLYLEGGGAVGKLISTNGLHFSAVDGIYYRNHRLYNDYQFSLNGGLNVELLSNARFPVSLGPVFHYHLTRNRRPAEFNNQYLSFLGLKGTVHLNLR